MDESRIESSSTELLLQPNEDDFALGEEEGEATSVSVVRYARSIWERRRTVLSIMAIGILLSLLNAILKPNFYTSSTSFMPPGNTSSFGSLMSMISNNPTSSISDEMLGLGTSGDLFVAILKSRNVQDALVTRFRLLQYFKAGTMLDARSALSLDTNVVEDPKSGIITVSVQARSPQFAAQLAEGYITELNRVVTDDSTSSAHKERVFLEGRVKDIKQDLDASSKMLSQFSTKNKAIDVQAQVRSMADAGLKLQAELIDGRSQLAALEQTYSADNSRVRALEAHNAELERQIGVLRGLSHAHGAAPDASGLPYPSASELPALGLTYSDLERKVRVDEALWEALTKQYEIAKVEEAKQIPTIRVLDPANVPERKSGPHRTLIVVIGTALSFLVACVVVFVMNYWEGMDPSSETKKLITDIAGAVPRWRRRRQTTARCAIAWQS